MNTAENIFTVFFLFACAFVNAQVEYLLDSDCWSGCYHMHRTANGEVLAAVTESCDETDLRQFVCTLQDGFLVPELTFEDEESEGLFSTDLGFYFVTRNTQEHYLRFIDNNLNLLTEVVLELSPLSSVHEVYVENDYVVIANFRDGLFFIERFELNTGNVQESVSFAGLPFVGFSTGFMFVESPETLYIGLMCGWIFKFDPLNLDETELLPLPFSEELGETYIPCSGVQDGLVPNPASSTLFTAANRGVLGDGEYYSFDFGFNGEHLMTEFIFFNGEYTLFNFTFDDLGNKYLIFSFHDDGETNNDRDFGIFKLNTENEVADSIFFSNSELTLSGHYIRLIGDELHLYGAKFLPDDYDKFISSYVIIDTNDFVTNMSEQPSNPFTFIQTDTQFGIKAEGQVLEQCIYDLTGKLQQKSKRTDLWQKSDFAPGTYVFKVVTKYGIQSHLIVVH